MPTPPNPLPCGCRTRWTRPVEGRLYVQHCPMHAAAGELLRQCQIAATIFDKMLSQAERQGIDGVAEASAEMKRQLHAAIALAQPK